MSLLLFGCQSASCHDIVSYFGNCTCFSLVVLRTVQSEHLSSPRRQPTPGFLRVSRRTSRHPVENRDASPFFGERAMISTTTLCGIRQQPIDLRGNNVSLTATVSPAMSGGPTLAGSVTFCAAGVALGKVAVTWFPFSSEGIATLTVGNHCPAGGSNLTCAFSGDGAQPSTSPVLSQTLRTRHANGAPLASGGNARGVRPSGAADGRDGRPRPADILPPTGSFEKLLPGSDPPGDRPRGATATDPGERVPPTPS